MRRIEGYRSARALEGYVLAEQTRVAKQAYRPGSARWIVIVKWRDERIFCGSNTGMIIIGLSRVP